MILEQNLEKFYTILQKKGEGVVNNEQNGGQRRENAVFARAERRIALFIAICVQCTKDQRKKDPLSSEYSKVSRCSSEIRHPCCT